MAKHPNIESNTAKIFDSVFEMMGTLNTEKAWREHLEKLRWDGEPICPHCGSQRENHYIIKGRIEDKFRYKCRDCRLPFTVKSEQSLRTHRFLYKSGLWQFSYLPPIRKIIVVTNYKEL